MSAFRADTAPHFRRFIPFGRPVAVVLAGDEYAEDQPAPSPNGRGAPSGVSLRVCGGGRSVTPPISIPKSLLNAFATALDQKSKHDHEENASNDPDEFCVIVHVELLSVFSGKGS